MLHTSYYDVIMTTQPPPTLTDFQRPLITCTLTLREDLRPV